MSKKSVEEKGLPLFIIFLLLSLAYFISTAFLFRASDVIDAEYYSAEWFLENSNAIVPSFPYFETVPNYTLEFYFEVSGDSRLYCWRFIVLSEYVEGEGWTIGDLRAEPYFVNVTGEHFGIKLSVLPTWFLRGFPLPALWDVSRQGPVIGSLSPYVSTIRNFDYEIQILEPDGIIVLNVSSPDEGLIGFRYFTYYNRINLYGIIGLFSKVIETKAEAERNATIARYLRIPPNYLSRYPEVLDVINSVALSPDKSVYDQLTHVMAYIFTNFNLKEQLVITRDPIADFVRNGGGPPTGFVNTTALILRALGIPTRIVIGFTGGNYIRSLNVTRYSLNNIAVWIEIWDKNLGWIPAWTYPFMFKIPDVLAPIRAEILAPRTLESYPAARVNESITVNVTLEGDFGILEGINAEVYDLNASVIVGQATVKKTGISRYGFLLSFNYGAIYGTLGTSITYGRHVILVRMSSVRILLELVLLRSTAII